VRYSQPVPLAMPWVHGPRHRAEIQSTGPFPVPWPMSGPRPSYNGQPARPTTLQVRPPSCRRVVETLVNRSSHPPANSNDTPTQKGRRGQPVLFHRRPTLRARGPSRLSGGRRSSPGGPPLFHWPPPLPRALRRALR